MPRASVKAGELAVDEHGGAGIAGNAHGEGDAVRSESVEGASAEGRRCRSVC